ncbi:hypothetical protein ACFFHF_10070 [Robertmurraya beringensis]|uniref:Uncharacterized protein n=1 Tax=Robertmurraya beringensis TaxID=641660 RepID=A0ABV6KQJ0_9BACI
MQFEVFAIIFNQRMKNVNKNKRLIAIEEYLADNFGLQVDFEGDVNKCKLQIMQLIRDEENQAKYILEDIANILNERYTIGEPFFVSSISTSHTAKELFGLLEDIFPEEIREYESVDFLREDITLDEVADKVVCTIRYTDYYLSPVTQERERELSNGKFTLSFDLSNNIFMSSNCGYSKLYNKAIQYLSESTTDIIIKQYYVQNKVRYMKDKTMSDFNPLSLLVVQLIYKKFTEIGLQLQSVDSLSFNNENAPRVKNAKLGGNDLFKDPDVVERLYNGDRITKCTVSIFKLTANDKAVSTKLTIDFRGVLKFTYDDSEFINESSLRNICLDILKGITELIDDEDSIKNGDALLREKLIKTAFRSKSVFAQLVKDIKKDIIELLNTDEDETGKIESYFKEKYGIESAE